MKPRAVRVVGINLPTFVERGCPSSALMPLPCVSSGLTSRPSLSAARGCSSRRLVPRVVGINLPTFVERSTSPTWTATSKWVSSGLTSRPSLSVEREAAHQVQIGLCRRD